MFLKRKNILYSLLIGELILLVIIFYSIFNITKSTSIDSCLTENFNDTFKNLDSLTINTEYNFDTIFNCTEWDEVFVIGGPLHKRSIFFLTSRVVLPDFDYDKYAEDTCFLYFLKNGSIVSETIPLWSSSFIFSNNFNKYNYLKVNREKAKFIYKKFENSDFELFTLKLKTGNSNG